MPVITELITEIGVVGNSDPLLKFNTALGSGIKQLGMFTTALFAGAAASAGILASINSSTSEMISLADAVGITTEQFMSYSHVAKKFGLGAETVTDMIEEMNNKFGESTALIAKGEDPISSVVEGLDMLGMSFKDISGLKPDEQFLKVSNAIDLMADSQVAASAADAIFSGEANKIFTIMKKRGITWKEATLAANEMNHMTDIGIKGARAYSDSFSDLSFSIGSAGREISGILGGTLTPVIKELTGDFSEWFKENKEWISGTATKVVNLADAMFKSFKRLAPVMKPLAIGLGIVTASIWVMNGGVTALTASLLANPISLVIAGIVAAIAVALLIIDDLIVAFHGGESAIGDFMQSVFGIDIVPYLKIAVDAFNTMVDVIMGYIDVLIDYVKILWDWFAPDFSKMINGIKWLAGKYVDYLFWVKDSVISLWKEFTPNLTPMIKVVKKAFNIVKSLFGFLINEFKRDLDFSGPINLIESVFKKMINNVTSFFKPFISMMDDTLGSIKSVGNFFGIGNAPKESKDTNDSDIPITNDQKDISSSFKPEIPVLEFDIPDIPDITITNDQKDISSSFKPEIPVLEFGIPDIPDIHITNDQKDISSSFKPDMPVLAFDIPDIPDIPITNDQKDISSSFKPVMPVLAFDIPDTNSSTGTDGLSAFEGYQRPTINNERTSVNNSVSNVMEQTNTINITANDAFEAKTGVAEALDNIFKNAQTASGRG